MRFYGFANEYLQSAYSMDRRKEPGAGAVSKFRSSLFYATRDIPQGMELSIHYGSDYFEDREHEFGQFPLMQDYRAAKRFINNFLTNNGDKNLTYFLA